MRDLTLANSNPNGFPGCRIKTRSIARTISEHLIDPLNKTSTWLLFGQPSFAVDGSQFAVPRTALAHDWRTPEKFSKMLSGDPACEKTRNHNDEHLRPSSSRTLLI
jgi:hypothetical protein